MVSKDIVSNYLQELKDSLKEKLSNKFFKIYPFKRTYKDKSTAIGIGKEVISRKEEITGLDESFHKYKSRLLLLGEPGGGKTISLIKFAIKKVEERIDNQSSLLPIFAEIYTWTEIYNDRKEISKESIIDWLAKQTKLEGDYLEKKIQDHQVLLLLDGLDELPLNVSQKPQDPNAPREDYRAKFIDSLNSLDGFQQVSIVISCRRRDYEEITGNDDNNPLNLNGAVVLNRLSEAEIKQYVTFDSTFTDNQQGARLWNLLDKSPDLLKMVRTPFLLYTLISTYQNQESDGEVKQFSRVSTHEQLFDRFIEQGFSIEKNKKENRSQQNLPCSSAEELKEKLGAIAVVMMSDSEPDNTKIEEQIFSKVIPQPEQRDAFTRLARTIQLLFETSEKQVYCFRHLLLRDYVAFRYANNFLQKGELQDDKSSSSISKIEVVKALGKLDNQRAVDLLTGVLNNNEEDKDVRYEAANSLGQFTSGVYFRGYRQTFGDDHVISYSLDEFSSDQTEEYFRQFVSKRSIERSIADEDVNKIDRISRGIPLVVNLAATMWREGIPVNDIVSEQGYSHAEIVATACGRFLTHFSKFQDTEEDLRAVYLLAMMRRFDSEFLQSMLNTPDLQSRGQELYQRYSFVSHELRLDDQHQVFFKKFLIEKQRNDSLVKEISREARIYLEKRFNEYDINQARDIRLTDSLTTSAEEWINNSENREIISDWIYYWFWKSEEEGWKYLIPYLVKGWFYNLDWARSLLDIPVQFTSTIQSSDLLRLFKWGLTSGTEDQSLLLEELEKRTNQRLEDKELIAIVLLKRGDLLFEQGKYQEAQDKYQKSKNYIPDQGITLRQKLLFSEQRVEAYIKNKDNIQNELLKVLKNIDNRLTREENQQPTSTSDNSDKNLEYQENYSPETSQDVPQQPSDTTSSPLLDALLANKLNSIPIKAVFLGFIVGVLLGVLISGNGNVLLWVLVGFLLGIIVGNDQIREASKGLYDQIIALIK
ncbi:MAG: HEAT repeat domain-containing protein [Moorea sp. SIO1F2]|uniref:NACHT domain-containing protein n=1 Tax=Moorena sp. SIO1F2 TaxID=2607819 RepID=UPI0013BA3958|nr:HEAT repeat domain-containing protein [Moorena sp. SIO1F2]NET85972.1 HEAT repeat domain-containing protein [Moorena sp. SIO1F2]